MIIEKIKSQSYKVDEVLDQHLDQLYFDAFENKYISKEALEGNERLHYFDVNYEIDFKIQINHVRSKYSKAMAGQKPLPLPDGAQCPICIENVGSKGKENLKQVGVQLQEEDFFLQLTPFPLYHHHFVLISKEHRPMEVSLNSYKRQLDFLDKMPHYTVCSNSDKEGAGASILSHLHYQVFKALRLPLFDAQPMKTTVVDNVSISLCYYPVSVIKLTSTSRSKMEETFDKALSLWRENDNSNTFNVVSRRNEGLYETYLVFRNASFTTPKELMKYKYEGIGVIEVCGEGILPTPEGEEKEALYQDIRLKGKRILVDILKGLDPLSSAQKNTFFRRLTENETVFNNIKK